MALAESGITIELREISLKDRPSSLYQISSKGTVPVLQINQNKIIDESIEIMLWAINQSNLDWLDKNPKGQLDIIKSNDTDFKYWLDRYKYADRYPEDTIHEYQNECKKILLSYENILDKKYYLYDNKYQLADIAIFPFIRQCENVDQNWFNINFPNLTAWIKKIKSSNLFIATMDKYQIWNQIDDGVIISFHTE